MNRKKKKQTVNRKKKKQTVNRKKTNCESKKKKTNCASAILAQGIVAQAARSVQNFGLPFVSMSVRDAPHQLIADLHGDLLREISAFMCVHWQGLGQAATALRKRNINGALTKKHNLLECLQPFETHHRDFCEHNSV